MKVRNVSRKSLFLYAGIFFCMLFFEQARLTPMLEREGANYPFLLTVNQYFQNIGEKTKIFAFNSFVHDEFAKIAEGDFFSSSQNLHPKLLAWWEEYLQTKSASAPKFTEEATEQKEPANKQEAATSTEEIKPENSVQTQIAQAEQPKQETAPITAQAKTVAENFQEKTAETKAEEVLPEVKAVSEIASENIPAPEQGIKSAVSEEPAEPANSAGQPVSDVQIQTAEAKTEIFSEYPPDNIPENSVPATAAEQAEPEKPAISAETAEEKTAAPEVHQTASQEHYTYNTFNYPFNENLVMPAETPDGIACYAAHIPDYGRKKRVLIVGDSMMMEGLGPTLHNRLRKRDNLDVHREGKYSSGLSRPDFYNWFENLPVMLENYQPDLLIMSLGANDTQDIVIDKKRYFIDTKAWSEIYLQRAKDFIALADNGKRQILWVSLPVMGKEPYFTRTKCITKLQAEASKTVANAQFINIEHLLTENGQYTTFYKGKNNQSIRLRSKDLIHVSSEGGEILTDYVLPSVDKDLAVLYAKDVPVCYPPVAGMANHVVFTSSLRKKQVEYYIWLPETKTALAKPQQENSDEIVPLDVAKTVQAQLGNKRYPVLYLLHGAMSSAKDYVDAIGKDLQKIATDKKVIIVAPSCEPYGWYVDSPLAADNQIAGFITKELIPHIDSLYPTTSKRAIAGLSMGGHGALLLGFQNKSLFQSMASVSGVLDIREHKNSWKIKNLLGELVPENQKIWDEHAVNAIIEKKWPATSPRQIIVVAGTEDKLIIAENRAAKDLFHKRGFHIDYVEAEGTHNWDFWKKHIPEILAKQADFLNKQ